MGPSTTGLVGFIVGRGCPTDADAKAIRQRHALNRFKYLHHPVEVVHGLVPSESVIPNQQPLPPLLIERTPEATADVVGGQWTGTTGGSHLSRSDGDDSTYSRNERVRPSRPVQNLRHWLRRQDDDVHD